MLDVPSLTVMVIVDVPLTLAPGVMVTVRLPPLPPNTILATGTKVVLLDDALTTRSAGGVSVSSTVNGMALVGVFSSVF